MRSLHVFVALLLASLLPGCSSSSSHSNPKTLQSVAVTPAQPSVALGVQQQFKATGMYSDGTSQDLTSTAVWTSSQTAVATISPGGLAITKATGTSSITAMSPPRRKRFHDAHGHCGLWRYCGDIGRKHYQRYADFDRGYSGQPRNRSDCH